MRVYSKLSRFAAAICLLLLPLTAVAGGATSGGGDDVGIEAKQALRLVTEMIRGDHSFFTAAVKNRLLTKADSIEKIIVVDSTLPVKTQVGTQNGEAYSRSNGASSIMKIVRRRWLANDDPAVQEALVFHELAVMAGIETTGDYHLSDQFKKKRAFFWEHMLSHGIACTISLYTKKINPYSRRTEPGQFVSAGGLVMNSNVDVRGGIVKVADLSKANKSPKTAVVFRYITSGTGYLRGVFSDATLLNSNDPNSLTSLTNNSEETIYFTPYDLVEISRQPVFREWTNYFTMVSCAKL